MKTILVPTDGSEPAEKALAIALDLAQKHDAELKLLHVLLRDKEPNELLRLPELQSAGEQIISELKQVGAGPKRPRSAEDIMSARSLPERPASEELLRKIGVHVLRRANAIAVERHVKTDVLDVADGNAAEAIAEAARKINADTIVMGMRGLRQIEAIAFGSVSQEVCLTVDCTCIAVH